MRRYSAAPPRRPLDRGAENAPREAHGPRGRAAQVPHLGTRRRAARGRRWGGGLPWGVALPTPTTRQNLAHVGACTSRCAPAPRVAERKARLALCEQRRIGKGRRAAHIGASEAQPAAIWARVPRLPALPQQCSGALCCSLPSAKGRQPRRQEHHNNHGHLQESQAQSLGQREVRASRDEVKAQRVLEQRLVARAPQDES